MNEDHEEFLEQKELQECYGEDAFDCVESVEEIYEDDSNEEQVEDVSTEEVSEVRGAESETITEEIVPVVEDHRPVRVRALELMNKQMEGNKDPFVDFIHNYLTDTKDENLLSQILRPGKTLRDCAAYCVNLAKQAAGNTSYAFGYGSSIEDSPLGKWIDSYLKGQETNVAPVAKASVKTGTKKSEVKADASAEAPVVKPVVPEKKPNPQTSLFDFL